MQGIEPWLNACTYYCAKLVRIRPVIIFPLTCLACILPRTRLRRDSSYRTKLAESSSVGSSLSLYSCSSSLTGRSKVMQSRSEKSVLNRRRVRFLLSVFSDMPACSCRASSIYSFGVIAAPSWFTRDRLKSRTSHRKDGNRLASSSGS